MASTLSTMPPIMSESPAARAMLHIASDSATPAFMSLMLIPCAARFAAIARRRSPNALTRPRRWARRRSVAVTAARRRAIVPAHRLLEELEGNAADGEPAQKSRASPGV